MPRTPRFDDLGHPLHVMAQGIERRAIFHDDFDRTGFVLRCARVFAEEGVQVLAWALMDNHVHLVLVPTRRRLGRAMQRVLGGHAVRFNQRHRRVGRLFRDRFLSRPCRDDDDLVNLVGYVILNPLRAGIVESVARLRDYPWTSLAEMVAAPARRPCLVDRAAALALFHQQPSRAMGEVLRLLAARLAAEGEAGVDAPARRLSERERNDLRAEGLVALDLRRDALKRALADRSSVTARRLRLEAEGWTLERVIARAAELCDASPDLVRTGGRRRPESAARSLAAYFATSHLGSSQTDVARATGVTRQSVGVARGRGHDLAKDRGLDWRAFFRDAGP